MDYKLVKIILFFCTIICISVTNATPQPQLDLPPIKSPEITENLVNNAAQSFTNDGDANEEANDGSQLNYDNDRSQRFGPPYSLDNIEGAPPTFDPRSRSNDRPFAYNDQQQFNRPGYSDRPRDQNYPNRPDNLNYPVRSDRREYPDRVNDPNFQNQPDRPRYGDRPNDRNYPDNFGYGNQPPKPNGDDDKYYRDRNRFYDDQYRPNNDDGRNRYGNDNRFGIPERGFEGYRPNNDDGVSWTP